MLFRLEIIILKRHSLAVERPVKDKWKSNRAKTCNYFRSVRGLW